MRDREDAPWGDADAIHIPGGAGLIVPRSAALQQLVEDITVDAYGDGEQLWAFLAAFDEVDLPCSAVLLDVSIDVVRIDFAGDERRGLTARCRHAGHGSELSIADLHFEPGSVAAWIHAAYRTWLGLRPFSAREPRGWSWAER